MKKLVWLLAVGLALTASHAAEKEAPKPKPVASVSGTVVNTKGKPIAGAKVYVMHKALGKQFGVVYTDKRGSFTYKPRVPETEPYFFFAAVAKGYGYATANWHPAQEDPVRIELLPGRDLKGTVVNEARKPLPGVSVSLDSASAYSRTGGRSQVHLQGLPTIAVTTTAKNGSFVLKSIPDLTSFDQCYVQLRLHKKGSAEIRKTLGAEDLAEKTRIVLPLGGLLQGKLLAPDKSGPPSESFYATLTVKGGWGSDSRGVKIEKNGSFRFNDMPPREISLSLQPMTRDEKGRAIQVSPYALPAQKLSLKPGESKDLELVMQRAAVVKGTVVDAATGKPVSGARLRVRHAGIGTGSWGDSLESDEKGEFTISAPAGKIDISVSYIEGKEGMQVYFGNDEDAPTASLTVAEGEEKSDFVVKVDLSQGQSYQTGGRKPTPPDFELIPGTYQLTWDPELNTGRIYSSERPKSPAEAKALMKNLPPGLFGKAKFSAAASILQTCSVGSTGEFTPYRASLQAYFATLAGVKARAVDPYYTVSQQSFRPVPHEEAVEISQQDAALFEGCEHQPNWENKRPETEVFAILRDGRIACSLLLGQIGPAAPSGRCVLAIQGLHTETPLRRQGLARQLVSYATESILRDGNVPMYWTGPENIASQGLCLGLGYTHYWQRVRYLWRRDS